MEQRLRQFVIQQVDTYTLRQTNHCSWQPDGAQQTFRKVTYTYKAEEKQGQHPGGVVKREAGG